MGESPPGPRTFRPPEQGAPRNTLETCPGERGAAPGAAWVSARFLSWLICCREQPVSRALVQLQPKRLQEEP